MLPFLAVAAGELHWTGSLEPVEFSMTRSGILAGTPGRMEPAGAPGTPLLPVLPLSFVIPPGAFDAGFTVEFGCPVTIRLPAAIVPAPVLRPLDGTPGDGSVPPDRSIYGSAEPWPRDRIVATRTGSLCGFRVASCVLSPWEYLPSEGLLTYYPELSVTVSWDEGRPVPLFTDMQIGSAARRLCRSVENPADIPRFSPAARPGTDADAVWVAVCDEDYVSELEPLRSMWEDSLGSAVIHTVQEIELSYPGADSAERLRNAIVDWWENEGAVFVLLAGDETLVPVRMVYSECEGWVDVLPTDHYFGDLDGTWDASGDGEYGQPDDDLDLYLDVLVGRALFSNPAEAGLFVDRTLTYATGAPPGPWRTTAVLCGAMLFDDIGYTGGKGCDSLAAALPQSWQKVKVYEDIAFTDGSDTHIAYIDAGSNWNYYAGHGRPLGVFWSEQPLLMMHVLIADTLANGDMAGIHTSIGCSPGAFHETRCLAEALLLNPGGGAVSVTFNTSFGWEGYWPELGASEYMCINFTRGIFVHHMESLGEAFAWAKDLRVPLIHGPYDRNLQSILAWTGFHDPALGALGVSPSTPIPPVRLSVGQPWPNPALRDAPITFDVSFTSGTAELAAWDMAGRQVWRMDVTGPGTFQWDGCSSSGRRMPAGVYLISARRGDVIASRRVVILE